MVAAKSAILIYVDSGDEVERKYEKLINVLTSTLEKDSYFIERIKTNDFEAALSTKLPAQSILIISNYKPGTDQSGLKNQQAILNFAISTDQNGIGNKVLSFCDDLTDESNFWLINNAFANKRDDVNNLVDLFKRLADGQDIPINRQVAQLTSATANNNKPDDFTAAVGRIENSTVFLDTSNESGSEIILVAGSFEENLQKSSLVWLSLCRILDLKTVIILPQPKKEIVAASIETVLVYNGKAVNEPFELSVSDLAQKSNVKLAHLSWEKLQNSSTTLHKICNALILASENSTTDFDDATKQRLLDYFLTGGKLLFLGDQKIDAAWMWFLKIAFGDDRQFSDVLSAFEKYSTGARIPENLQCSQMSASDKQNFCTAMLHAGRSIPVLYLSAENGGVVAFVRAEPKKLIDEGPEAWKDLLRMLGIDQPPGQDDRFNRDRVIERVKDDVIKQKPPNLFIYAPDKDNFRRYVGMFTRVLQRNTYVIYPLSQDHLHSIPWAPYCRTLFLTPQPSKTYDLDGRRRIADYFHGSIKSLGGKEKEEKASGFETCGRIMQLLTPESLEQPFDPDQFWLLKEAVGGDSILAEDLASRFIRFVQTNAMPTNLLTKPMGKADKNEPEYYAAMLRIENSASVLYVAPDHKRSLALVVEQQNEKMEPDAADEMWRELLRIMDLDVAVSYQPPLTSGYLFCRDEATINKTCTLMKSTTSESTPEMLFVKVRTTSDATMPTFPIRVGEKRQDFDYKLFFRALQTEHLGEAVIFIPVARSLIHFITCFSDLASELGILIVAEEQISAPNEIGKIWLSPVGAAAFAFNVKVAKNSLLGQKIGFVKCLATLAILNGIRATPSFIETSKHSAFPLGLRWPDDVYYDNKIKIGAVQSKLTSVGDDYIVALGFGVNVSNKKPTACLNDFINDKVSPFNIESIIASILNEFEKILALCQKDGPSVVAALFDKDYFHIGSKISLWKTNEVGTILGVSDMGHLRIQLDSGNAVSVNADPDVELCTNSLDCLIKID